MPREKREISGADIGIRSDEIVTEDDGAYNDRTAWTL